MSSHQLRRNRALPLVGSPANDGGMRVALQRLLQGGGTLTAVFLAILGMGGPEGAIGALRASINFLLKGTGYEAAPWLTPEVLARPVQVAFLVAAAVVLAWAFWPAGRTTRTGTGKLDITPAASIEEAQPRPGLLVQIHHGTLYTLAPPTGLLPTAQLNRANGERLGRLWHFTQVLPTPEDKWMESPEAYRCDVINYSGKPLLNVSFDLAVLFREAIFDGNTIRQGEATETQPWRIEIGHLPPGPEGMFSFYLWNTGDWAATANFPSEATAAPLGSTERAAFTLTTVPASSPLLFPTFKDRAEGSCPPSPPSTAT